MGVEVTRGSTSATSSAQSLDSRDRWQIETQMWSSIITVTLIQLEQFKTLLKESNTLLIYKLEERGQLTKYYAHQAVTTSMRRTMVTSSLRTAQNPPWREWFR